jgi:hypothetical protein
MARMVWPFAPVLVAGLLLTSSCGAFAPQGATVNGAVDIGGTFGVTAARKVRADIERIDYKLLTSPGGVQVGSTFSVNKSTQAGSVFGATTTCRFLTVPDGTYVMTADAFDAGSVNITQGGTVTSANTVTVTSPNVTYTAGAAGVTTNLTIALPLLNGTGETINNTTTVTDGSLWTGSPVGSL